MAMTVRGLIQVAADQFTESDTAKLDAQLLLGDVLGKDRTWLMTWDDVDVSDADQQQFLALVVRRARGEPIAHILGYREFWGLSFECNASTLIPRPETELLVEKALQLGLSPKARVLDLGTGTGAIALALASEQPVWQITATDFSSEALALASRNQINLGISNVELIKSDWFSAMQPQRQFDLVVSNPPYVDPGSPYLNKGDVRFEPRSALTAEKSGLADIEKIASSAPRYLKPGGWLMVEHGYEQAGPVAEIFRRSGFSSISNHKDLAGWPRVTVGQIA
jgi:release factor glutamine methyltransferase